ncbi:MAG: hypothetical protein H7101_09235 [Deinococcales bacterium]|nr:hypothetical protein [Chitinophagaceae bacterium]
MRKISFIITLLAGSFALNAQSINVSGFIKDINGNFLENATIKLLKNDTLGLVKSFTITKKDGFFSINIANANQKLLLQVSMIGYKDYNEQINSLNKDISLTIYLEKFIGVLPEVNVKTVLPITKNGDTTKYRVSAFEKGNENSLSDLLKKLPGISVDENGKASFNGKPISRVLLENDDLLGSDYSAITNNSGISGIERIDVIENYKDNSRLENAKAKGNETVINLQYKKKLVRLFGNSSVGGSLQDYEIKNSNTGIVGKHKFLLTANINSIGNLAARIFGIGNNLEPISNANEQLPHPLQFYTAPVQFYDTKPLTISDARLFTNASNLITINHLVKPIKTFSIKINANYLHDNYSQTSSTKQIINTSSTTPLVIEETNATTKHNQLVNFSSEINWLISNSSQAIVQYNSNYINLNQRKDGTLFSSINGQEVVDKKRHQFLNLITTKVFGENKILSLQFVYNSNHLYNQYTVANPLSDTSFGVSVYYKHLLQYYQLPSTLLSAQVKYQFKMGTFNCNFILATNNEQIDISNRTALYNKVDSMVQLPVSYNGSMDLVVNQSTASFGVSKEFSKKLSVSLNICALYIKQSLSNAYATNILASNMFFTPSLSSQYRFSNKKIAFFNLDMQPVYPSVSQLYDANVFTSLNAINKGTNQFNYNSGYGLSIGYFFIDPIQSGIIYNAFVTVRNSPPNYLTNISNRGLLIFSDYIPFNEKNSFFIFSNKIEKNIASIKSFAIVNGSLTYASLYSSANLSFIVNRSTSYTLEGKLRTNWNKWFNINIGLLFQSQSQKSRGSTYNQPAIKSSDVIANATISLKLQHKLFIDFQNDYYVNHSYNTSVRSLFFTDILAKYVITNRFSASLSLCNIFNQTSFTKSDIGPIQTNVSDFGLRPFWSIASLQMKF